MNEQLGKYMTAVPLKQELGRATLRYEVIDRHGGRLGMVAWYTKWRQYCFEPDGSSVFSMDCLHDLADFLRRVNKEHKPAYVPKR